MSEEENLELKSIQEHYEYIKVLFESLEKDMLKSEKGNRSAAIRLRKGLRHLRESTTNFIKFTLKN